MFHKAVFGGERQSSQDALLEMLAPHSHPLPHCGTPRLGILVLCILYRYSVFTSLAKSLLDASIGPMQKPAAALVWPFTIINKVIGTCDNLQEHKYDSTIVKAHHSRKRESLCFNFREWACS